MLKIVTKFLLSIITGANAVTILLLLAMGYSDRIDPVNHPMLACIGMAFPLLLLANLLFLLLWLCVKWRRMWIPVTGFALAYVPIRTYIPLRVVSQPPQDALLVVSYNVAGFDARRNPDALDSICAYLKRLQPDIVCLQEDMGVGEIKPFERLAELFDYNDTVHVNSVKQTYINAIGMHSRFPILKHEVIEYGSDTNGSVAFFLLVDGDTVIVVNNHLESTHLTPDERNRYKEVLKGDMETDSARKETRLLVNKISERMAERAPQALAVHSYVEAHSRYPIIVCGDFNDTPISYARRTIAKGLTDCFVESGSGLGLSYNQKGFYFRIDHMMCSSHFIPIRCEIDSKMDASDHYPLISWLKMVDKP